MYEMIESLPTWAVFGLFTLTIVGLAFVLCLIAIFVHWLIIKPREQLEEMHQYMKTINHNLLLVAKKFEDDVLDDIAKRMPKKPKGEQP